jgi:anti-sigma factor RsiW
MFRRFACPATRRSLPDYATNRLSSAERDRVERHLAICRDCSAAHHKLRRAVELEKAARLDPLPTSLTSWDDLRAQLDVSPQPARGRRAATPLLLAGTAMAAAGLGIVFLWRVNAQHSHPHAPIRIATHPPATRRNAPLLADRIAERDAAKVVRPSASEANVAATSGDGVKTSAPQTATKPGAQREPLPSNIAGVTHRGFPKPGVSVERAVTQQRGNPLPALMVEPSQQVSQATANDIAFINADAEASMKRWTTRPSSELQLLDVALQQQLKGGDDFVTVPLPSIAGQGADAVKAAVVAQQREAAVIDTRLVRRVSMQAKGISFFDLCERLRRESGVRVTANRSVADDKITIFCHPRPLRDLMRQISRHFGFNWVRKGEEGSYEYELTQTLRSKLLEEGMREQDQEQMLLAIDQAMEPYRKFSGLSFEQINALGANATKENLQPLFQLENGGIVPMNLYFALSRNELDLLRTGQTLTLDLSGKDASLLPPALTNGIRHTFDACYERERLNAAEHGYQAQPPDPSSPITATLQLDRSKPGEFALKGDLSDGRTGLGTNLAVAKSPAYDVHNARTNAALAQDPQLQREVTIKPAATCILPKNRYPDTDGLFESVGNKVTTADVMEEIYKVTGMDIVSDYFSHLHSPESVTEVNVRLYDALNQSGDRMGMRWTKQDGWLQFRTGAFYYDRPQEVPNRLLERWQSARKKQNGLTPEELVEIAQLPDSQLDSLWMAQGAEAIYGLREWQMGRNAQFRPQWRFLARLSEEQRRAACSEKGLAFGRMTPEQQSHFLELAYDGDASRPGIAQIAGGSLRLLYALNGHSISEGASYAILPGNPILMIYSCSVPGARKRLAVVGPFNATYGMLEEHLTPQALEILPGREDQ